MLYYNCKREIKQKKGSIKMMYLDLVIAIDELMDEGEIDQFDEITAKGMKKIFDKMKENEEDD